MKTFTKRRLRNGTYTRRAFLIDRDLFERLWPHGQASKFLGYGLAIIAIYFIAGKLGLMLASLHASASPVWPPAGIALAALLLLGYRTAPAIFVAAFLVNVTTAGNLATSFAIAAGNTLEAVAAAWLINRLVASKNIFDRPQNVFKFAGAIAVSTIISPSFGVTSLALAGFADWANYGAIWLTWWLGDATADLIVTPCVLLWSASFKRRWNKREVLEVGTLLFLLCFFGGAVFGGWLGISSRNYPVTLICGPIVIWTAFRFTQRETATGILLLSAMAIWGTLHGFGPFVKETENQSFVALQLWIGVLAITAIALSAGMADRKRAEKGLRESEQRFRTMADGAPVMIWLSGTDKLCTWFNERWLEFTGRTMEQELGNGWADSVHKEDFDRCLKTYAESFDARQPFTMEYRLRHHDGEWRWVLDHGVPIYAGEDFTEYIGSCIDVTDRKRDEEALREALRTKDHFLASVSHELRTPLTPVLMMTEILQRNRTLPLPVKNMLNVIGRNVQLEAKLVNDLLDLSRANTGKLRVQLNECDIHEIVECAVRVCLGPRTDKQLNVETTLNATRRSCSGDPTRLQQVFWNLIQNATKFTSPGGSIKITSRNEYGRVCVDVSDTGCGIEAANLERIFEQFAEKNGAIAGNGGQLGLGLGLAIARQIVVAHEGTLVVASDGVNRGATFTVSLPTSLETTDLSPLVEKPSLEKAQSLAANAQIEPFSSYKLPA